MSKELIRLMIVGKAKDDFVFREPEFMTGTNRAERLQIMLTLDELEALDDWRFEKRMPSRASAVRELLKRGLEAEGFDFAKQGKKSQTFGVIDDAAS